MDISSLKQEIQALMEDIIVKSVQDMNERQLAFMLGQSLILLDLAHRAICDLTENN